MKSPSAYIASLDGLRGISILIVFVAHIGFENLIPGGLGVTIFFFISGYLITNLLIDEYQQSGSVSLKLFYSRRMLRLYPPLLLMITLFVLLQHYLHRPVYQGQLFPALFYYENYYYFYTTHRDTTIGILWSLAVEEHFYLLFPLIFILLFRKPKALTAALVVLIFVPLVFRFVGASRYAYSKDLADAYCYLMTHTRFDAILFGCLASVLLYSKSSALYRTVLSNKLVFIAALLVQLLCLVLRNDLFRNTLRYTLQGMSLFILVPAIVNINSYQWINKLLSGRIIVWIGRLSYSIYLMHMMPVNYLAFLKSGGHAGLYYTAVAGATILIASFSYYVIEKPLGKLRKRLRPKAVLRSATATSEYAITPQVTDGIAKA